MRHFFITGTDTEIGKTFITCALLKHYAQWGEQIVGFKPIAAGMESREGVWVNEDVELLRQCSQPPQNAASLSTYVFHEPASPHIAAQLNEQVIDIANIVAQFEKLKSQHDSVLVEGVGGFDVPLSLDLSTMDMAKALHLPVILVVGLRLGCINHANLTTQAIVNSGLKIAAWVANTVDENMKHVGSNVLAIRARMAQITGAQVPFLGIVPRLSGDNTLEKIKQAQAYIQYEWLDKPDHSVSSVSSLSDGQ